VNLLLFFNVKIFLVEINMTSGNPQWYWNASSNPFAPNQPAVWTPYSAEDNQLIEQQFKNKSPKADLQNHTIHFQEHMQVHKSDFHRQRPIKREPKE
jgi:hypothetical protein